MLHVPTHSFPTRRSSDLHWLHGGSSLDSPGRSAAEDYSQSFARDRLDIRPDARVQSRRLDARLVSRETPSCDHSLRLSWMGGWLFEKAGQGASAVRRQETADAECGAGHIGRAYRRARRSEAFLTEQLPSNLVD